MTKKYSNSTLGAAVFDDIENNVYLNEIYENLLYNYSIKLFRLNKPLMPVNKTDALRFADILSKSPDIHNSDKHKIWAQEIISMMHELYPDDNKVTICAGSVLSNTGNRVSLKNVFPGYKASAILDRIYNDFSSDYYTIPADENGQFFRSQKDVYDHLNDAYFSFSAPTSMGKSFVMRMFVKAMIQRGATVNFAVIVPTKALINETTSKFINDLNDLLAEHNYRLVNSAGALVLKEDHNFIFVLTPERLLYLIISNPNIKIDYLFVDEAHKISSGGSRSTFYYKEIDMLADQEPKPKVIFSSPNIPNPDLYLSLVPGAEVTDESTLASKYSPTSQFSYYLDYVNGKSVYIYNPHTNKFSFLANMKKESTIHGMLRYMGQNASSIIYCNATYKAVDMALEYADPMPPLNNKDLDTLAKEIRQVVHNDYYLAKLISKGVAYHIGYLPTTIRRRIEDLYREGLIKTIFCTSTLIEGVNLPADNLFITSYYAGRAQLSPVDFKNLIGRVGRLDYSLFGNVFLVRLDENTKPEKFEELLQKEVPEQKLSVDADLTASQKEAIVKCIASGDLTLSSVKNLTQDKYGSARKFSLILVKNIIDDKDSYVRRAFEKYLTPDVVAAVKEHFTGREIEPDHDINISVDQTTNLVSAIQQGLAYPKKNANDNFDYAELLDFLETLCRIFKWEKYESKTLGYTNNGNHSMLKWYAVVLAQWMSGTGLSFITQKAIEYKQTHKDSKVSIQGKLVEYDDSIEHRNSVISETLSVIENIILFSISNYFLKFSTEYKRIHQIEVIPGNNDWYEFVEYGTCNTLTITLQRNGFTRETSTYIKSHQSDYVRIENNEIRLSKDLLTCDNLGVQKEAREIAYNIPELFIENE